MSPITLTPSTSLPLHGDDICCRRHLRTGLGWGAAIGTLGGLVGLGGAEFRLPVLLQFFRLTPLLAVMVNLRVSLVTVSAALIFRLVTQGSSGVGSHLMVAMPVLLGALLGAWLGAGLASKLDARHLRHAIAVLLAGLALVMLFHDSLLGNGRLALSGMDGAVAGLLAGVGIGVVSSLLGVAGGELIIPALVLLYGLDIKMAGTVSLAISLPTLLVGFARYRRRDLGVRVPNGLFRGLALGSICGAALGAALLGAISPPAIHALLGVILMISAVKLLWMARKAG